MWIWVIISALFLKGISLIIKGLNIFDGRHSSIKVISRELNEVVNLVSRWADLTRSGWVLDEETESRIAALPDPWSFVLLQVTSKLKLTGASILPTLKKISELAKFQLDSLQMAKAQSSQAEMQAYFSFLSIPVFSVVLYIFLPALSDHKILWCITALLFAIFGMLGLLWILQMAQSARFGGMKVDMRHMPFRLQVFLESTLAYIRSGMPADMAWEQSTLTFVSSYSGIQLFLPPTIWSESKIGFVTQGREAELAQMFEDCKFKIQNGLLQGHSVIETIENEAEKLRTTYRSWVSREVQCLGTKVLKPLFIFVAPGAFILLAMGLFLSWSDIFEQI